MGLSPATNLLDIMASSITVQVSYTSTVRTTGTVQVPAKILEGLSADQANGAAYDYFFSSGWTLDDEDEELLGTDDDSLEVIVPES